MGCNDVVRSLGERWPSLNLEAPAALAKVRIELTRRDEAGRRVYLVRAFEMNHGVYAELPNVMFGRIVNDGAPSNIETGMVVGFIQQALLVFFTQTAPSTEQNGQFAANYQLPQPQLGRRSRTGTNWYFAPGMSIYASGGQGLDMNGSISETVNYSTRRWRFRHDANVGYRRVRFTDGTTGTITDADVFSYGGSFLVLRSLSSHVNIAAMTGYSHDPRQNYDHSISGQLAIEWIRVPAQQTLSHNFALRYSMGPVWNQYMATTTLGQNRDLFVQHTASALVFLHFEAADLSASVNATTNLPRFDFPRFNFGLSASMRPTARVTISAWGNLGYLPQRFNTWVTPPNDDLAVLSSFGAGFGEVVYQIGLDAKFILGAENDFRGDRRMDDFN